MITVITSTPWSAAIAAAVSAPADAAELQATISSFAPRSSSSVVLRSTSSRSSSCVFVPYGKCPLSPR